MTTTTYLNSDCSVHLHHYIGFLPSHKELKKRGWTYDIVGPSAEGPSYKKITDSGVFHLQIV